MCVSNSQVQLCVLGSTHLSSPSSTVFATISVRGTEILRTENVSPQDLVSTDDTSDPVLVSALDNAASVNSLPHSKLPGDIPADEAREELAVSHRWTAKHNNSCLIPLAEESSDRREVEVEIDLWEVGVEDKGKGDNLGQVGASADLQGTPCVGFPPLCRVLFPLLSSQFLHLLYTNCPSLFRVWLAPPGDLLACFPSCFLGARVRQALVTSFFIINSTLSTQRMMTVERQSPPCRFQRNH